MAGVDDPAKFMEMLLTAMKTMADKDKAEKEKKAERKIFDKDYLKHAKEFNGDKSEYNEWSFKWKISMKMSNAKFAKVIDKVENLEEEFDIERTAWMQKMDSS